MIAPSHKGWCPSAYRPMTVEDGLLARIRPHMGRLTRAQALGICELAETCGNTLIEFTNRANLQIRGISRDSHPKLLEGLKHVGLLDPDPKIEKRRSILATPFWRPGDETEQLANGLVGRLLDLPNLPAKFGFVIDLGPELLLKDASGDIRVERSAEGLIVRADGAPKGRPVTMETCLDVLVEMSHWFGARRTAERRRMAHVVAHEGLPAAWATAPPLNGSTRPAVGPHLLGHLVEFGVRPFPSDQLAAAIEDNEVEAIRLTPWRMVLLEGSSSHVEARVDSRLVSKAS